MATICWVVPRIKADQFTGGMYCILRHAHGLAQRGHNVVVVPLQPSSSPRWFPGFAGTIAPSGRWRTFRKACARAIAASPRSLRAEARVQAFADAIVTLEPRLYRFSLRHGVLCRRASLLLPPADVTVATSFETALPVHLHGTGRKFYFCQHFEPFFANEFDEPAYAEVAARASYSLPLQLVANSPWLAGQLKEAAHRDVTVAGNAIDEAMLTTSSKVASDERTLRVISYGGRGARWKGMAEMAEGMALARRTCSLPIEWSVYGACELPPDNPIAPYRALGFLNPQQLAKAYSDNDVLLSASWYESFPLFPLEAMACGLATITTQAGTEAYARHLETAFVIEPRDPAAIAQALVTLAMDRDLRQTLAAGGRRAASQFTWDRAVERMEQVLTGARDPR